MPKNTPLRRRIAPSVPVLIEFSDENGVFSQIYRLAFNLDALAAISEKTGLAALTFEIWEKLSASVLRAMFWAALLTYQPEFSGPGGFESASSMLDEPNQVRALDALWEAYLLYKPPDEAKLLREAKSRAEAEEAGKTDGAKKPDPLASPAPIQTTPVTAQTSDGSSSGPSADTTSDLPTAISAS